ncbi:MAG: FAD-dependent monooxygenase, partial [Magnetovibrio sp.]|nr:FAD-dependent monooxygenase [Magnetovibrio sp.]
MTLAKKTSSAAQELSVDVLIIGGGLAGGTLSLALAQNGFDVVTVDKDDTKAWVDRGFDGRASAIALSSQRVLERVGLWDILKSETAPIKEIRVADGHSPLFLHYDHEQLGTDPFGFMMENRSLRTALNTLVPKTKGLHYFAPNTVVELDRSAVGVQAKLDDGTNIKARLVVACDGRGSKTREDAGIRLTKWDYKQAGIVCTVE